MQYYLPSPILGDYVIVKMPYFEKDEGKHSLAFYRAIPLAQDPEMISESMPEP